MKNQYVGDNRDLFKYDLITEIIKGLKLQQRFTFIPMLTPNDASNQGNERDFSEKDAGWKNKPLRVFLERFHNMHKDKRDFREVANYFRMVDIQTCIYNSDVYFEKSKRSDYFENIPQDLLENPLIFLDPDIGLQIKISTEKHILFSEIKESIYKRINNESIIMIFQFIPTVLKEKHDKYIERRLSDLSGISNNFTYITNNIIIFFLLAKNQNQIKNIKNLLKQYINVYPRLMEFNKF